MDTETKQTYQSKLQSIIKETYRLMSIGAGEGDMANVMLDSETISKCVPKKLSSSDDTEGIAYNESLKAVGESVTNVTVQPNDTLEGYPENYTYRLNGADGVTMDVKLKVSTTNGDVRMKASINIRLINGAWKITSIDSSRNIFTELSVLDPEW